MSETNGRNGLFMKVVIGVLVAGLGSATIGLVRLNSEVAVLKAGSGLEKRVDGLEVLARDIGTDRDKRTVIIQGFIKDIDEIKQRIERLERRR